MLNCGGAAPRYALMWHKSRLDEGKIVLWTPSVNRASQVAFMLEWSGWFSIFDTCTSTTIVPHFRV